MKPVPRTLADDLAIWGIVILAVIILGYLVLNE